jgi:hypothetical protein
MLYKRTVLCSAAAVLAVAIACSNSSQNPVSPSGSENGSGNAGPDGATLKATAPTVVSPVNGAQPDGLLLVARTSEGKFDKSMPLTYQFQISTGSGAVVSDCTRTVAADAGGTTVSYNAACVLEFDQPYTWKVRARSTIGGQDFVGPWSANASFRAPAGGYIRDNEVFDPLTNGKTAGDINGGVQFIAGQGAKLLGHDSFIRYKLPVNLQQGEFSMMILGADEGAEGDKSKVFSMQEGPNEGDITDDDYRMTAELRGANYGAPGSIAYRIIFGDGQSRDGDREQHNFESSRWYFWRFTWATGSARLEVREDGPSGRVIYSRTPSGGAGSHPYRPDPHYLYLGTAMGRAGALDATLPGGIYKNVWASSRPRPAFPGE